MRSSATGAWQERRRDKELGTGPSSRGSAALRRDTREAEAAPWAHVGAHGWGATPFSDTGGSGNPRRAPASAGGQRRGTHRPGGGGDSVLGLCAVREGWVLGGSVLEMDAQSEGAPGGARTWVDSVRRLSPRELGPGVPSSGAHPAPRAHAHRGSRPGTHPPRRLRDTRGVRLSV